MKRKKCWVKKRHNLVLKLCKTFVASYIKNKYGFSCQKFDDTINRPYLILSNHQTSLDQLMMEMPLSRMAYIVASEDIFSIRLGKLISFLAAPIPLIKGQKNLQTVLTCRQIAAEGGTIVLAPEGNRTYSGKTEYISPSVVKLARLLKLPIAFFVFRGGYGVRPRWSDAPRKGKMTANIESVLEYDEYKNMTDEQLFDVISKALYVDESNDGKEFFGKNLAMRLERVVFLCPKCGIAHFESSGDFLRCTSCGMTVQYKPNKQFCLTDGSEAPYQNVNQWYEAQKDFVRKFVPINPDEVITFDKNVSVFKVELCKRKTKILKNVDLTLYCDKLVFCNKNKTKHYVFDFGNRVNSMAVLGKNKLEILCDDIVLQVKGEAGFNALKYLMFFFRYKNFLEDKNDDRQFLGL